MIKNTAKTSLQNISLRILEVLISQNQPIFSWVARFLPIEVDEIIFVSYMILCIRCIHKQWFEFSLNGILRIDNFNGGQRGSYRGSAKRRHCWGRSSRCAYTKKRDLQRIQTFANGSGWTWLGWLEKILLFIGFHIKWIINC